MSAAAIEFSGRDVLGERVKKAVEAVDRDGLVPAICDLLDCSAIIDRVRALGPAPLLTMPGPETLAPPPMLSMPGNSESLYRTAKDVLVSWQI